MINKLKAIIDQKQREVEILYHQIEKYPEHPIVQILENKFSYKTKSFKKVLQETPLSVIAEIKRQSPSKGMLSNIPDPVNLAMNYIHSGASAISVLTDKLFFGGSLEDLSIVSSALKPYPQPVLRKDFIIDEIQIAEALARGADAVLGIVAVLGAQTQKILNAACRMGIEVIVEVHNTAEIEIALESGADIIGINNRDLRTFEIDIQHALTLIEALPNPVIKIAESGIIDPRVARNYFHAGFHAVLIGEALVKSEQPEKFIKACRYDTV